MDLTNVNSMELLRKLGLADLLREKGKLNATHCFSGADLASVSCSKSYISLSLCRFVFDRTSSTTSPIQMGVTKR